MQASFKLPWKISKQHGVENYHQALAAPPYICQKTFLPQPDPNLPPRILGSCSWRRWLPMPKPSSFEWKETNLPTLGQPHLLAWSLLEQTEEMKHYISFPDEAIFSSMALPGGSLTTWSEETTPKNTQPVYVNPPLKRPL